ncbi:hypothetical protein COO20_05560 [Thalassospira marina]|uniref:Uncharacterized protein n=1 Tax=Thalassospira marina TaxID=2048283 RepID=A0A2N3KWB2_9PROT|nr:hypothetical protein COO20_05560 [Thalassospira marina]
MWSGPDFLQCEFAIAIILPFCLVSMDIPDDWNGGKKQGERLREMHAIVAKIGHLGVMSIG